VLPPPPPPVSVFLIVLLSVNQSPINCHLRAKKEWRLPKASRAALSVMKFAVLDQWPFVPFLTSPYLATVMINEKRVLNNH